jgi:hypothetical protein
MVLAFEIRNNRLGINEQMCVPADVSFFRWTSLSRRRQEPEANILLGNFWRPEIFHEPFHDGVFPDFSTSSIALLLLSEPFTVSSLKDCYFVSG